jgi:hypothetical protein
VSSVLKWHDTAPHGTQRSKLTHHTFTQAKVCNTDTLSSGGLVGLISPANFGPFGPLEPRLFSVEGVNYFAYNHDTYSRPSTWSDTTYFFELDHLRSIHPLIDGEVRSVRGKHNNLQGRFTRDKHWIPLIRGNRSFFVRYFDPLQVLECHLTSGDCTIEFYQGENKVRSSIGLIARN